MSKPRNLKSWWRKQCLAQIADADEGAFPDAVNAERVFDGIDEVLDVVANATHAEFAEVGKVLADLGRIDSCRRGLRVPRKRPGSLRA